jgi:protein-S-isoprenylcysteine O-methyltransferase Ste14
MTGNESDGYGLWTLVIINSAIIIIFVFSFTRPKSKTDWRSLGTFSAFILALFTEMYGFPLTIYFLSGWLSDIFPGLDVFSHNNGHLWTVFLGSDLDPHLNPIHLIANLFVFLGFFILVSAWKILHKAQISKNLAKTGIYGFIRHPQYIGFLAIMLGFLMMWPTISTLIMFPILLLMYYKLSVTEESSMIKEFGEVYLEYKRITPAFFPNTSF